MKATTLKAWLPALVALIVGLVGWRIAAGDARERPGGAGRRLVQALDVGSLRVREAAGIETQPLQPREAVGPGDLRLRILEFDGAPVHAQTIRLRFEPVPDDGEDHDQPGYVDADGVLAIALPDRLVDEPERRLVVSSVRDRNGNRVGAELALPDALVPGENDLGELRLEDGALLAEGLVVDGTGAPVPYATVAFRAPIDVPGDAAGDAPGESLVHTDASGRFRIVDTEGGATSLELTARHKNARTRAPTTVAPGARGLHLRILADGALRGRVRLPGSLASANLRVVATPADARREPIRMKPTRGGDVSAFNVEPGRYTVAVQLGDGAEPLHVQPDVRVDGGAVTRMFDLDLRDVLRELIVEVGTTDRAAVDATLSYRPSGDPNAPWTTVGAPGRVALTVASGAVDLRAEAWGYLPAAVQDVTANARITLEPAFGLEIEVQTPRADCAYHVELTDPANGRTLAAASLSRPPARAHRGSASDDPREWAGEPRPQKRPHARVTVPRTGPLDVVVTVTRFPDSLAAETVRVVRRIEVDEGRRQQQVSVWLKPEELPWPPIEPEGESSDDRYR